jgi:hypothetical protein
MTTPRSCAWWRARPANAGRNEWWMPRCGWVSGDGAVAEHLHVAGEHDQIDALA